MAYVIDPAARPAIPVRGGGEFPVRRIWCVGRNYAEHAREMGHDPDREPPFFFAKHADTIVLASLGAKAALPFPPMTADLHHEIELVVAIGKGGVDITEDAALDHVYGYSLGLDMTRRDLQAIAKKAGRPWEMGKAFDLSCPVGEIVPAATIGHPDKGAIWVKTNGTVRQTGDLSQQIWNVPGCISQLSKLVALAPGDLIMTGTPAGVSAVKPGDVLDGHIDGIGDIQVSYLAVAAELKAVA